MAIDLNKILEKLAREVDDDIKQAFKDAEEVRLRWPMVQIRTEQGAILHTNEQDWPPKMTAQMAP